MHRLTVSFTAIWVMTLFSVAFAQDRGWVSSIAWSPTGKTIAVGGIAGVWFFDNDFNELGQVAIEQQGTIRTAPRFVAWNARGDLVVYSGQVVDSIKVVDVDKLAVVTEIDVSHLSSLEVPVVWHPSEDLIIGGFYGGTTHVWDATSGEEVFYFDSWAEDPHLRWYDPAGFCWFDGNKVVIINHEMGYVMDIAENRMLGKLYIDFATKPTSCNRDYQILSHGGWLFDVETRSDQYVMEYDEDAFAIEWSPDSTQIIIGALKCRLRILANPSFEVLAELPGSAYSFGPSIWFYMDSIDWHPDGSRFAVVGQSGDIRVWNAETYELMQRFDGFEMHPNLMAHLEKSGQSGNERCP